MNDTRIANNTSVNTSVVNTSVANTSVVDISTNDFLLIKEAAEFLGVCKATLRNWHASGKLIPSVHIITRIRMYNRKDLEKFLEEVKNSRGITDGHDE